MGICSFTKAQLSDLRRDTSFLNLLSKPFNNFGRSMPYLVIKPVVMVDAISCPVLGEIRGEIYSLIIRYIQAKIKGARFMLSRDRGRITSFRFKATLYN